MPSVPYLSGSPLLLASAPDDIEVQRVMPSGSLSQSSQTEKPRSRYFRSEFRNGRSDPPNSRAFAPDPPPPDHRAPRHHGYGCGWIGQIVITIGIILAAAVIFGSLSHFEDLIRQVTVAVGSQWAPDRQPDRLIVPGGPVAVTNPPSGTVRPPRPTQPPPPTQPFIPTQPGSSAPTVLSNRGSVHVNDNCNPPTSFHVGMTVVVDTASRSGASTRIAAWTQPGGNVHNSDAEPGARLYITGGPECVYNEQYRQYLRYWRVEFTNRNGRYVSGNAWVAESIWEGNLLNYLICPLTTPDC